MRVDEYLEEVKNKAEQDQSPKDWQTEKSDLQSLLTENHMSIEQLESVFSTYQQLLPLMSVASQHELSNPYHIETIKELQLNLARLNAAKLAILFGSADKAIEYLKRNEKYTSSHGQNSSQMIHDACSFTLAEGNKWNPKLWQSIVSSNPPTQPTEMVMRLLPLAGKIEQYVNENRKTIEADERVKITKEIIHAYAEKFAKEYESEARKDGETKEKWIAEKMKSLDKRIRKEKNDAFENYIKKELNILEAPNARQWGDIATKKNNPNTADLVKKAELEHAVDKNYQKKFEDEYNLLKQSSPTKNKEEYIRTKLAVVENEINKNIEDKIASQLLSETASIPIATLMNHAKSFVYARAHENPTAARLFYSHLMPEERFDQYLALRPQDDEQKIPAAKITGEEIKPEYKDYYIMKLAPDDPRAAILGEFTSCCQSIGKEGEKCAIHGITDPRGGFYVLCKKKSASAPSSSADTILAQCWAWRNDKGDLVFDSVESQVDFRYKNQSMITSFYTHLAEKLVREKNVNRVLVGRGGNTPETLGLVRPFQIATLENYQGYGDSERQYIIADKEMPLLNLLAHDELRKYSPLITQNAILKLCDHYYRFDDLDRSQFMQFIKNTGIDEQFVNARLDLITEHNSFIYRIRQKDNQIDMTELERLIKIDKSLLHIPILYGDTMLSIAITKGDINAIKYLVSHGANLNAVDDRGTPALRYACCSNIDTFKFLVQEYGLDINQKNNNGDTLIHEAASQGNSSIVDYLIKQGVNPNTLNLKGKIALDTVFNGWGVRDWNVVDLLLNKTPNISLKTALRLLDKALSSKEIFDKDIFISRIIKCCPDLMNDFDFMAKIFNNEQVKGKWPVVRTLISHGIKLNDTKDDVSIIELAYQNNQFDIIKFMIDRKIDIDSAIHKALGKRNWSLIKTLVTYGLDPDYIDNKFDAPVLTWLIVRGETDFIRWLTIRGVDVNASQDEDHNTALHMACINEKWEIADWFIEHGAKIDAKNAEGCTALILAANRGGWDIVTKLINRGADVTAKDAKGNSLITMDLPDDIAKLVRKAMPAAEKSMAAKGHIRFFQNVPPLLTHSPAKIDDEAKKSLTRKNSR